MSTINTAFTPEFKTILNAFERRCDSYEPHAKILVFTSSGRARLTSICGWLVGLYQGGQEEFANHAASELAKTFDYLAYHTMCPYETPHGWAGLVPSSRVLISDDGTFNGFSFVKGAPLLFQEMHHGDSKALPDLRYTMWAPDDQLERLRQQHIPTDFSVDYSRAIVGGMIYHGPSVRGHNTFTVNTGNSLWGLHT